MTDDERMRQIFDELRFPDEPPMTTTAGEVVARGERGLRRRRLAVVCASAASVVVIAAGVALAVPGDPTTPLDAGFAGGGTSGDSADVPPTATPSEAPPTELTPSPDATPSEEPPPPDATPTPDETGVPSLPPNQTPEPDSTPPDYELPFPETRQLLLDTAVEHLDPEHTHLPEEASGFSGGHVADIANVGTKLAWTNPGEDGMGMVRVAVTGPGYADSEEYAFEDFAFDVGCGIGPMAEGQPNCAERELPGGDTVWIAEADDGQGLVVGAVYERPDGSLVGVGAFDLFGNNSTVPVSEINLDADAAIAFVTDPDVRIVAGEPDPSTDTGILPGN